MNADRHLERFCRCPENLEIGFVELPLADLGRNFHAAQSQLRGTFEFLCGADRILEWNRCERREVPRIAARERRHRVVIHLCNSEAEVIRNVWVQEKWDTRDGLQCDTFSLHVRN